MSAKHRCPYCGSTRYYLEDHVKFMRLLDGRSFGVRTTPQNMYNAVCSKCGRAFYYEAHAKAPQLEERKGESNEQKEA